jgi:diguanylate cyclase (GGDEF)-like protein
VPPGSKIIVGRPTNDSPAFDSVTGLPGREHFLDYIELLNHQARKARTSYAMMVIDLDHFRVVNHSMGVAAGDKLLLAVAHRLSGNIEAEHDRVFRIAGNEFSIVMRISENALPFEEAQELAQIRSTEILKVVERPFLVLSDGEALVEYRGSASIGVSPFQAGIESGLTAYDTATMALHIGKKTGGGHVRAHNPSLDIDFKLRCQMETALREAVSIQSLYVVYQPQVDSNGDPRSAEALLRWDSSNMGVVSPSTFIPLAEELGLINEIGCFVIDTVCQQLAAWEREGGAIAELSLAVNVSALQLHGDNLDLAVQEILARTGANPQKLKLEITESALMESMERASKVLQKLNNMGVQISLDDFGTGYTSFEYLNRLPISEIKIDRSFISKVSTGAFDKVITQVILDLGKALEIDVVAEGFETVEQVEQLKGMGCQLFQGYHFAKPALPRRFERYILNYNSQCDLNAEDSDHPPL